MSVKDEKNKLRRIAKECRSDWTKKASAGAAVSLKENFLCTFKKFIAQKGKSHVISGFWPIADEIDVRPLIDDLHKAGHTVALPVVVGENKPLIFRIWKPELALIDGGFGTCHPDPNQPEVYPDVLLVPLLAFDSYGQRLGWGGGFYDRTISKLRARGSVITVGIAYQMQQVKNVPHSDTDEPLDWIVTDLGALDIIKR